MATYPAHREADVALRDGSTVHVRPIRESDWDAMLNAREMIRGLATYPLLEGYRGSVTVDIPSLEDVLLRVSMMVEAHPEILEMDCNPIKVTPGGATIVDARVRVSAAEPELPVSARRRD